MNGMLETFIGQCRLVDSSMTVKVLKELEQEVLVRLLPDESNILLVAAPNIAGGGNWWYADPDHLRRVAKGVAVFYGYAQSTGAVAECQGNNFKDDYRRFSYTSSVRTGGNGYCPYLFEEIRYLLSERNIELFREGRALETLKSR